MQHARKLVLVEPHFNRPTIKDNTLGKLDSEISQILNGDEDDYTKMILYGSVLRRYKTYDEERKPAVNNLEALEDKVLKSTPYNLQYKAKRILTQLGKDSDVNFTPEGKLVYKQVPVDDSNILDIISDVLKNTTTLTPGSEEIAQSLKATKTVPELIDNSDILKLVQPKKRPDKKTVAKKKKPVVVSPLHKYMKLRKRTATWEEY